MGHLVLVSKEITPKGGPPDPALSSLCMNEKARAKLEKGFQSAAKKLSGAPLFVPLGVCSEGKGYRFLTPDNGGPKITTTGWYDLPPAHRASNKYGDALTELAPKAGIGHRLQAQALLNRYSQLVMPVLKMYRELGKDIPTGRMVIEAKSTGGRTVDVRLLFADSATVERMENRLRYLHGHKRLKSPRLVEMEARCWGNKEVAQFPLDVVNLMADLAQTKMFDVEKGTLCEAPGLGFSYASVSSDHAKGLGRKRAECGVCIVDLKSNGAAAKKGLQRGDLIAAISEPNPTTVMGGTATATLERVSALLSAVQKKDSVFISAQGLDGSVRFAYLKSK